MYNLEQGQNSIRDRHKQLPPGGLPIGQDSGKIQCDPEEMFGTPQPGRKTFIWLVGE
jgi:hypothetical protein